MCLGIHRNLGWRMTFFFIAKVKSLLCEANDFEIHEKKLVEQQTFALSVQGVEKNGLLVHKTYKCVHMRCQSCC